MSDRSFETNTEGTQEGENSTQNENQGPSFESSSDNQQQTQTQTQEDGSERFQRQIQGMEKRIADKDDFIKQLQDENKSLREKTSTLEEKMDELSQRSQSVEEVLERMKSSNQGGSEGDSPGLTQEDVERLAAQTYQQQEEQRRYEANTKTIAQELQKVYGSEIDQRVSELAKENDMTFDEAFDRAGRKPNAFRRLFLSGSSGGDVSAPSGSVNTAGLEANSSTQSKPKEKFHNLKSQKDQVRHIQEKARELGVKF